MGNSFCSDGSTNMFWYVLIFNLLLWYRLKNPLDLPYKHIILPEQLNQDPYSEEKPSASKLDKLSVGTQVLFFVWIASRFL